MSKERIQQKNPDVTDALVDATGRLMEQLGYRKTSMEDIAAAAGVSRATAYLYFPNKEAMLVAWIDRRTSERLLALQAVIRAEADPIQRVRKAVLARIEFSLDGARGWGERIDELLTAVRLAPEEWRRRMLHDEAALLVETLSLPCFRCPVSPQATSELLSLATHGLFYNHLGRHRLDEKHDLRQQAEQLIDLLLGGIVRS